MRDTGIPTDVVCGVVYLSVCLSVGHVHVPCENEAQNLPLEETISTGTTTFKRPRDHRKYATLLRLPGTGILLHVAV